MQELVRRRADDDRTGLIFAGQEWSWAAVVAEGLARATWFDHVERSGPPHVGLLLPNGPEFVFHLTAVALAGTVVVGLNTTRRGAELARDVRHSDCQVVLTDPEHAPLLQGGDLGAATGRVIDVTSVQYREAIASRVGPRASHDDVDDAQLFMLIFTSGTTGAPKAVRCSQGKIATQGRGLAERLGLGPEDVSYLSMPLFHSNAIIAGWTPTLAAGATAAVVERFSASRFIPDVRRFGATYANYVGKPLSYVLAQPPRDDDADNPLRLVFGNEASPGAITEFADRFDCVVQDGFGSTEGGVSVSRTPDTPAGSIGRPVGDVRIVDPETGAECPPARFDPSGRLLNDREATGEMVNFDGVGSFEGYYANERETAARTRRGRYHSGDLAYRDENGFFYHAGRTGDWLRVDGENFAAAPVARIVGQHPDVVAATIYAVPDPAAGDQTMAAVQLRRRASFDGPGFSRWLDGQDDLAPKWRPRFVRVSDELPTTPTSKILVRVLSADGIVCDDPVWWSPGPGQPYRLLTEDDIDELHRQFEEHGRGHLLGRHRSPHGREHVLSSRSSTGA